MATLASYIKDKMRGKSIRDVAQPSGVSRGTLHQMMTGVTLKPSPDTLANLARYFGGGNDEEAERYYTEMMSICGYLDLLPDIKVEVSPPPIDEKVILDRLSPTVRAYAESLRERNQAEYQEFLEFLDSQEREATRHGNRG